MKIKKSNNTKKLTTTLYNNMIISIYMLVRFLCSNESVEIFPQKPKSKILETAFTDKFIISTMTVTSGVGESIS